MFMFLSSSHCVFMFGFLDCIPHWTWPGTWAAPVSASALAHHCLWSWCTVRPHPGEDSHCSVVEQRHWVGGRWTPPENEELSLAWVLKRPSQVPRTHTSTHSRHLSKNQMQSLLPTNISAARLFKDGSGHRIWGKCLRYIWYISFPEFQLAW